jgi:hypothetical protein
MLAGEGITVMVFCFAFVFWIQFICDVFGDADTTTFGEVDTNVGFGDIVMVFFVIVLTDEETMVVEIVLTHFVSAIEIIFIGGGL